MTRRNLSTRDWENCSAYLDGQLSEKQTGYFLLELEHRPELQLALKELQRTKIVLKSVSKIRAPHNFTLSSQMVGRSTLAPKSNMVSLLPFLRFSSVAASLLLVLVVISNLFLGSINRPSALAPVLPAVEKAVMETPAPTQVQVTMAAEAMTQAVQPPPEPMAKEMEQPANADLLPQEPSYDVGGGMGEAAEPPAMLAQPVTESTSVYGNVITATQLAPIATAYTMTEELRQPYPAPSQTLIIKAAELQVNRPAESVENQINWWLIMEIGLAGIALLCGISAILIKRRSG